MNGGFAAGGVYDGALRRLRVFDWHQAVAPQRIADDGADVTARSTGNNAIQPAGPTSRNQGSTFSKPIGDTPATDTTPTQIAATTRHQDQRVLAGYIRAGRGKDDIAHVL